MQSNCCFSDSDIASLASSYKDLLSADANANYDEVIEIDLDKVIILIYYCFGIYVFSVFRIKNCSRFKIFVHG